VGQGGGGLGNGITDAAVVTYPIMVAAASDKYFTKLHNSMGLCHDGSVFAWGNTSNGFSGTNVGGTLSTPTALAGGHSFIDIFGGSNWNGALKANGEVWTWGFNGQGQLGDNSVTTRSTPVQVAGGHSFISVAGSRDGVAAVRHDGLIYTWGRRAGTTAISTPTLLAGGQSFAKVCSGGLDNFFAIQADGTAYGWGTNETGVLGDSSTTARNTPVAVSGTHKFYDILGFGDNDGISCAFGVRRPQGDIYAWGSSRSSQGNGGVVGTSSPNPTLWGSGFAPVYSNQLLRELQTTPGETIAYDLTNPGAYNELIGRTLGVRYTSFVVEYFA
jgi:alpha-tubulin suppressor-like RCC1 family protein